MKYFINHFKYLFYLVVLIGFSGAKAGSYEDFFAAVQRDDASAVTALLNRGFDPNARSPAGETGLFLAVREPSLKVAAALINWPKTEVEARNSKDESPLMMAALKGATPIARELIGKGADVNKPGWAPLHYAATGGQLDVMQLLLDNYAYIDASSPNGSTPLMMAAQYGTPESVKLLLDAGADASLKNSLGLTAIDFAMRVERTDSAQLIANALRAKQPKGKW